jgi:hypothetical protein
MNEKREAGLFNQPCSTVKQQHRGILVAGLSGDTIRPARGLISGGVPEAVLNPQH